MNTLPQKNIENLIDLFYDSKEGLMVIDENRDILHLNNSAKDLLEIKGNVQNISEIEHRFNFDVCVLNEDQLVTYNPLTELTLSNEKFKAEVQYQINREQYKNLIIKSEKLNKNIVIFISDISAEIENIELKRQQSLQIQQIEELEKINREYSALRERAESQAIRVSLINRISTAIRDTLDINDITETAVNEISKTLGVYRGLFASYDREKQIFKVLHEWHISNVSYSRGKIINTENSNLIRDILLKHAAQISKAQDEIETQLNESAEGIKPRLIIPVVYQEEVLGIMLFYHNNNREWHAEEVSLVEGISAQLAAAIYQASLYEQLANQKEELELALIKLKETQIQLIQSEKMASLGKLVAGVAHEINTPLGSLSSNIDMLNKCTAKLKDKLHSQNELNSIFNVMDGIKTVNNEAIKRINIIVKSLKNFARLDESELKQVDIHEGIRSSIMLINHEIKDRVKIIEEYGEVPLIECYPNLMNQVFMNMLVNAYQSIEGSGIIKIKTDMEYNKVRITISDTGIGITQDNLDKIFDPGFTTKGVGIGTGLGLSICYQIIEKHGGSIGVESQVGLGTSFIIEIPLSQKPEC